MSNKVVVFGAPSAPPLSSSGWPSLVERSKIRGAMWTQRLKLPMGPFPDQDFNICGMDYYEFYGPEDRKRMIDKVLSGGYNSAPTGPMYDPDGYHGMWPTNVDLSRDYFQRYLDKMEEWKAAKIMPIHFIKPDNWTFLQTRRILEPLYDDDRARDLLPIIVPPGWEPWKYNASTRTWGKFFDWGHQLFPEALIIGHSVCDVDALKGNDDLYNDEPESNGLSWQYVAPKMHGWFVQLCGYLNIDRNDPRAMAQWESNLAGYFQDLKRRFEQGYPGDWARGSLWGPNVPLPRYLAECASYRFDRDGSIPESEPRRFGDIAVANDAAGYFDGGSVDVPGVKI